MEELQSTEALDRELLEDARKKAFRILKTAGDAITANAESWEKKTREAIAELEKHYAGLRQESIVEILARLPLEMRRIWSEKVEAFLDAAVEDWFRGLSREQVLALLTRELECRLAGCPEFTAAGTVRVGIKSLSRTEAGALLRKHLPQAVPVFEDPPASGEMAAAENGPASSGSYPELVLDIPPVKLSASIKQAVDALLLSKRAELIEALLGPEALSGPGGVTPETGSEGAQGD
jgi:ATP-dependent helicase YprA (DUF1998 family)